MKLNDPLYKSEANARTFAGRIEFFKQAKDALPVFGRNSDAVVTHKENGMVRSVVIVQTDLDDRFRLSAHVLGGVVEKVLQNLYQT
jgi:hypothetical protein